MTRLSDSALRQIRERADAATEGPWTAADEVHEGKQRKVLRRDYGSDGVLFGTHCVEAEEAQYDLDCVFAAHARSDVPRLLEHIEAGFDLIAHLHRQREFSERTFGPGTRTQGVIDHIKKELIEIEAKPADLMEWVDVILLAMDGAWRSGHSPEEIAAAIETKQTRNESRHWPDWRTVEAGKAIEHIRTLPPPADGGQSE